MKNINFILFILFSIFINSLLFAQLEASMTADDEAFARGRLIEFGITNYGVYGAAVTDTPAGYHDNRHLNGFGFIANPLDDGWVDYDGDFFTPGSPEEGFCIEIDGINYCNNNSSSSTDIAGVIDDASIVTGECSSSFAQISWSGSIEGLTIERTHRVSESGLFIEMETSITNTTDAVVPDVFWMHNIDPDNNQTITGNYTTNQELVEQASSPTDNISIVTATQEPSGALDTDGSSISYYAQDARARVTFGGFANRNASDVWYAVGIFVNTEGATNTQDEAISIAFNLGNIASGETKTFKYWYVTGPSTDLENFTGIGYSTFGTNLTTPEASDGMITISGLTPDDTYTIQYDYNGTTIDATDYIANTDGKIIITGLDEGTYDNIIITHDECISELTDIILLQVSLILEIPSDYKVCDDDYDGVALFDLSTKNEEILGDLDSDNYTVNYYISEADANTATSPIDVSISYMNISNPQTIWVRVESLDTDYFALTTLDLRALPIPIVNMYPDALEEDDDTTADGLVTTFDLNDAIADIMNSFTGTLEFYESLADAESGTAPIPEENYIDYANDVPYLDYVWAVVTDNESDLLCSVIVRLTLIVNDSDISINDVVDNIASVFPNPSNGSFTIKTLDNYKYLDLSVVNIIGETIYKQLGVTTNSTRIDLSNKQTGVYILKIIADDKQQTIKLIVLD